MLTKSHNNLIFMSLCQYTTYLTLQSRTLFIFEKTLAMAEIYSKTIIFDVDITCKN